MSHISPKVRTLPKVVVIVGPTASGKTALSIALARAINGEVVSADSRQVYRGLDVGSGKVTKKEMRGVPHHLLDVANPKSVYTASDFVQDGRKAIAGIISRKKVPIIAGGTGFYIDALLGTIALPDVPPNPAFRLQLSDYSLEKLQKTLKKLDSASYKRIDIYNPVRLIRAIEIATALGRVPTQKNKPLYNALFLGVALSSGELQKKIHTRLFARIRGIEREVKKLHAQGLSWKRMEALGLEYRYMARYLQKKIPKATMLSELEKEINRYAKRQMTWFKRNHDSNWIAPKKTNDAIRLSRAFLKN